MGKLNEGSIIGIAIMLLGLIFAIAETAYFGWNLTPQSTQESIADFISFIIQMTGLIIFHINKGGKIYE